MCILVTTNANSDFPFVLVSNRDEYFKRATQQVTKHYYNNHEIISPLDMARSDHGTWLALNPAMKKFAILVNYREGIKDTINPISRGVLPLDYVTSNASTRNEYLTEMVLKYGDEKLLTKIGGFNLLFGDLLKNRYDIISNKNDADFKIFSTKPEYHGLSNSSFDEPWEKVRIGETLLKEITESYNDRPIPKNEFIDKLFELLSHNTLDNVTDDYQANFDKIKSSIFVPPLTVRDYNRNNSFAGEYYGTRTQTVILVDKSHHLSYIERNLHSSDDLNEEPTYTTFEFDLNEDLNSQNA